MDYTIQRIVCGAYQENAYLLCAAGRNDCVLIDPGDDISTLRRAVAASGRRLGGILLTHGHFDHILAAQPLQAETGAPVFAHAQDIPRLCDAQLNSYNAMCSALPCPSRLDAEAYAAELELCGLRFEVLHTPGHTPGSICLYDAANALLFSGDTLFCAGYGRVELPGGSPREMRASLRNLFALPAAVRVYPGHGGETMIGDERARYNV